MNLVTVLRVAGKLLAENNYVGLPTGWTDRNGTLVHVGDLVAFDEKEWGEPCEFVVEMAKGELVVCGSPSDLQDFCTIVRKWDAP